MVSVFTIVTIPIFVLGAVLISAIFIRLVIPLLTLIVPHLFDYCSSYEHLSKLACRRVYKDGT